MFPWLLLAYRRAVDISAVRYTALGGLVGASLILAGSAPAAVYSFLGLGLYAFADWWRERRHWLRTAAIEAVVGAPVDPLRFRANVYVAGWPAWA